MSGFANYSVNGELLLDTEQFDEQIVSAADKLKGLTTALETLGKVSGINKTIESLEKLSGVAKEDSAKMDELKSKYNEVGSGASEAGSKIEGFRSKISSTVSAMARYNSQAKAAYTTNLSTAQSFTRLGTLAQTAGKRIEGMTYMMRRLRSMGTMVATIFAWDMAMGMIESTKATIEAKSEMESFYDILHMGSVEINSFNKTLDNTVSKFARINKFQLGSTLTSLAVEFDLTQDEMNKAANVVPMVMNEYLRAGRSTEEAVLAVKDIMQGEFMRLSRETGVGKEELKAAGWSGDTKDIQTLMEALEKVGNSRHWATFAAKANSLNDVILITENRFTEFAANITDRITPWIVRGFNVLIWAFDGLSNAYEGMSGFGQGVTQFLLWGSAIAGLVKLIEGRAIPTLQRFINARAANLMGLNAEEAKVNGIAATYAAAAYAEETETLIKDANTLAEYKKIAASQASIASKEMETAVNEIATAAVEKNITADEAAIVAKEMLAEETARLNAIKEVEAVLMEELIATTEATSIAESEQFMATELSVGAIGAKALAIEAESLAAEANIEISEARNIILTREKLAEASTIELLAAKVLGLEAETVAQHGVVTALYMRIASGSAYVGTLEAEEFATLGAAAATEEFTIALLTNPVFLGITAGILAVVGALAILASATAKDREEMEAYNKVLDDANNNLDQLPAKYKKIAENVKKFDEEYKKFLEADLQYSSERKYLAEESLGLLTEEEKKYHELYGIASDAVNKLKQSKQAIQSMSDSEVFIEVKYAEKAKNSGWNNQEAKDIGRGMSGWKDWEKRSYEDYLQTDDFMIQLESLLGIYLARAGLQISGKFWDYFFDFKNNNTIPLQNWWNSWNMDSILMTPITNWWNSWSINDMLNQYIKQPLMDWWNSWSFADIINAGAVTGAGGFILSLLGLDENSIQITISDIELKLQRIIDSIKWYLDPANWLSAGEDMITQWWNTHIADPLQGVLSIFGIDLHVGGQQAGQNLKNGMSEGSSGTPQEVMNNVNPIKGYLNAAKTNIGSIARSLGLGIKSNTKSGSSGTHLPVVSEMQDIYNSIKNKQGSIWSIAFSTAKGIVGQIVSGLNRKSPGDSAKATLQEMNDMGMFINQSKPMLYASALGAGKAIVQGMNDAHMSDMQNSQAVAFGLNNATLTNTTNTYNQLNGVVSSAFGMISNTIGNTGLSVSNNLTNMSNTARTTFTDMSSTANSQMIELSDSNKKNLSVMSDSTLSATLNMSNAWNVMKNNIVNAANQIRTQSYNKFKSLHSTISSFYNQLATAHFSSGLAAGVPTTNGSKVLNARVGRTWGSTGGRIKSPRRHSMNFAGTPNKYAGITDVPNTHLKKIMDTVYPWKIADPWFLGIQIPMDNTVGTFKNGNSKKVSYSNFEEILTKVLTARGFRNPGSYDFYWNSRKSNQQVWDSVSCNCYDGAEMIVEIAQMLGLSGGLVHGSWKGIGHMGAMVGGKLYDMTQFQKHGVFRGTSGVVFGTNSGTSRHSAGRAIDKYGSNSSTNVENKTIVNVDLSNSNIYGIDDLDNRIKSTVNETVIKLHGKNPVTGV